MADSDFKRNRSDALRFLHDLQTELARIPSSEVHEWLRNTSSDFEGQFLTRFVHPRVYSFLTDRLGPQQAKEAFLAESRQARSQGLASGSPASAKKHLFTKELGMPAKFLVDRWWGGGQKQALAQSCPDFAFRTPCAHRIVFEAKLFRRGGIDAAKTDLVRGIYQCFYYLGQPHVPSEGKKPAWDYKYACLFAYDCSAAQSMTKAWEQKADRIRTDCWESSNVFVIVLPSSQS